METKHLATAPTGDSIIAWFETLNRTDGARVGGKNASLGELVSSLGAAGLNVPGGFATTAQAYWELINAPTIASGLKGRLEAFKAGTASLQETGRAIRQLFLETELPETIRAPIADAYRELSRRASQPEAAVAVRSSATAEDLPDASFAGQQESFLNIVGEGPLIEACRRCYASLFTDRAIAYREAKGFDHMSVALSIGVQLMVRADLGSSGVMFSLEPETGFPRVAVISAAWGLGETVVQGTIEPDSYQVFKPFLSDSRLRPIIDKRVGTKLQKLVYASDGHASTRLVETTPHEREDYVLSDDEILELARWAVLIEQHYGRPMDMEWAKDGRTGEMFLVQARPETVHSRQQGSTVKSWRLNGKLPEPICTGASVGAAVAAGTACLIRSADDIDQFPEGAILVTENTDPDWVPIMKRAAGIVTDHGGPTSHAAIVSRELGVPAVIGTGNATLRIVSGDDITISCVDGEIGSVYPGRLPFSSEEMDLVDLPKTRTAMMVNVANPASAFSWWRLPSKGVGLARMEFIISNHIRVHPMALAHPERVTDPKARQAIADLTRSHPDPQEYFVEKLARGVAKLAAAHHPHPVIIRLSDFKSNEYAHLLGGDGFEPVEENPMLGFRGASRYYNERYRDGFALECRALRRARTEYGFTNLVIMVPFCRTILEADQVLAELSRHGLNRGEDGLQIFVMAEIPANIVLAEEFAARFDGFSIGSNDLTQLVLGVDRDSELLAPLFDERDPAVLKMIADLIVRAHRSGRRVGICGQAPSNHAEYASFLVKQGIDSISLDPDSFVATLRRIAEAESAADH